MLRQINALWRRLTHPIPAITQPDIRRQSRLLTTITVILVAAFVLTYALPLLFQMYPTSVEEASLMFAGMLVWLYVHRLAMQGHYERGAKLLVISISAMIFGSTITADSLSASWTMYYLLIPIMVSSVFLSQRYTFLFIVVNIVGLMLLAEITPDISHQDLPVMFVTVNSAVIMAFNEHRRYLEADRQAILSANETRYRTLYESISDAIAVTEGGHLRDVNPAFEAMFDTTCPQIYDNNISRFAPIEDDPTPHEVVAKRADGTPFYAEIRTQSFEQQGKRFQVSSIRDITDRILAAKADIDLALEREKVALMQQFINDASHDLRTPLTVIYTSIHLLRRGVEINPMSERHLNNLEAQAGHLNEMIENLINLARLDKAVHKRMEFVSSSINGVADESAKEQRPYAQTQGVDLLVDLDGQIPNFALDPHEIRRALRQLIVNAIRYTPKGGTVIVSTQKEADDVLIKVIDTGIGISEEDQEHIFDLFYRADTARQSESGGMGIGLNICQRIIEAHDGQILVTSTPGKGTMFTIRLPIRVPVAAKTK